MSVPYNIISTGSQGNAVIVDNFVLVDCGVPYKAIQPYMRDLRLVLLTHIHGDHFKASTIRTLAQNRPTLRFGACSWMAKPLVDAGVPIKNIDVYDVGRKYEYTATCSVQPVMLAHDVPNCGYKLDLPDGRVIYATDTSNLNGINAKDYDLFLIEANYDDEEIKERIDEKKKEGAFIYEKRVLQYHLSMKKALDFIYANIGQSGEYVFLHGHVDEEKEEA